MAGSKSDWLEKAILNMVLGGATYTPTANVYLALSTAAYSDAATGASMNEVSSTDTGYARVALTNNSVTWPNATGTNPAVKQNAVAITFPTATGSWGTLMSFYICDQASGGNVLYGGDLSASKAVYNGDTATFAIGSLVVTED